MRSAEGTAVGHKNAEGMACRGILVERTVRLWREVEGRGEHVGLRFELRAGVGGNAHGRYLGGSDLTQNS